MPGAGVWPEAGEPKLAPPRAVFTGALPAPIPPKCVCTVCAWGVHGVCTGCASARTNRGFGALTLADGFEAGVRHPAVAGDIGAAGARLQRLGQADPHLLYMAGFARDRKHLAGEPGVVAQPGLLDE